MKYMVSWNEEFKNGFDETSGFNAYEDVPNYFNFYLINENSKEDAVMLFLNNYYTKIIVDEFTREETFKQIMLSFTIDCFYDEDLLENYANQKQINELKERIYNCYIELSTKSDKFKMELDKKSDAIYSTGDDMDEIYAEKICQKFTYHSLFDLLTEQEKIKAYFMTYKLDVSVIELNEM